MRIGKNGRSNNRVRKELLEFIKTDPKWFIKQLKKLKNLNSKMLHHETCKTDIPQLMEITGIAEEGKAKKSFFFRHSLNCKPGQFVMVWLPGIDEKPMAVSYWNKNEFAFTSHAIGRFTKALDALKKGDKVGIRGPYGNCFSAKSNAVVVGGGAGMASVSTLIDVLKNPLIINGGRSKENLIYLKRFKDKNMIATTDDGSYGVNGFTTDVLEVLLSGDKSRISGFLKKQKIALKEQFFDIDIVYTCGPEIMMKRVFEICNKYKVECEASLERYMACGFGICGKCMINDRICCVDGPVFNSNQLSQLSEFGNFARLKSGRKVALREYYGTH